jgi:hypothetical protein
MLSEAIEATDSNGVKLRVEFVWLGDRFGQVVSATESEGEVVSVLESVEGTKVDDWPPSPPLQSLRIEELPGGRCVALLVGMAGRSHWSASVEPVAGEAALIFDVACRHPPGAQWLGSRYRRLSEGADKLVVQPEMGRLVEDQRGIAVEPAAGAVLPATTRWKFKLGLR